MFVRFLQNVVRETQLRKRPILDVAYDRLSQLNNSFVSMKTVRFISVSLSVAAQADLTQLLLFDIVCYLQYCDKSTVRYCVLTVLFERNLTP